MLDLQNTDIFRLALESLQTGVCLVDREGKIAFWNDGAERITGYLRQDVLGRSYGEILPVKFQENPDGLCERTCPLVTAMRDGQTQEARAYLHHRSGYPVPVHLQVVPLRDARGRVVGAVESFVERSGVSPRGRPERDLAVGRGLDAVTHLPDCAYTEAHLAGRLRFASEHAIPFGLLCVQLDQLDGLTATHGRDAGEALLKVAAHTLRNGLDTLDFVGCWPEDQFLAIVTDCADGALMSTAERLKRLVQSSEIAWWGDRLATTVSIGGTVLRPGESIESLLDRTGNALGQAVARGGNLAIALDAPDAS